MDKLPVASKDEIEKYRADNIKFIHLCRTEETLDDNFVNNTVKRYKLNAKPHRNRPGRVTEEQEDDNKSTSSDESYGDSINS